MGIKAKIFIKLPYIINLEEKKDYKFSFEFDEFDIFNLEIKFNSEEDEDIYEKDYPINSSKNIEIHALYINFNHLEYQVKNDGEIEIPQKQQNYIFNLISKKLTEILNYLKEETNMFWIEDININDSYYNEATKVEFNFYSPDTDLNKCIRKTYSISDYYMINNSIMDISSLNDNIFNEFIERKEVEIYKNYLRKAQKSLYERDFENFIIYSAISVESYIENYIEKIRTESENDIIFTALNNINNNYIHLKYNTLLKYLKGKSLKELKQSNFDFLKRMYTLRNGLMHQGRIDEKVLKKAGIDNINFDECSKILNAIQDSFKLINEL